MKCVDLAVGNAIRFGEIPQLTDAHLGSSQRRDAAGRRIDTAGLRVK
jgi:hypothetical protein